MIKRFSKRWGIKEILMQNSLFELCLLHIEPNRRCSWHRHRLVFNYFYVLKGSLFVKQGLLEEDKDLKSYQMINEAHCWTVAPPSWHEFAAFKDGATVIEMQYIVEFNPSDIIRFDVGGSTFPTGNKEGEIS